MTRISFVLAMLSAAIVSGCNKSSPKKLVKEVHLYRVECMMGQGQGVDIFTRATDVSVTMDGTVIELQDGSTTTYSPSVSCKVMKQAPEVKV